MILSLPKEITDELHATCGELRLTDPSTDRVYVLIDDETHRRAMHALKLQEDWEAILEGAAQADRGETMSVDEARARLKRQVGISS